MHRSLSLLVYALLLAGCTATLAPYSVKSGTDEFNGSSTVRMNNNLIGGLGMFGERLGINAMKTAVEDTTAYAILVEYRDSDWMFIEDGESLIFLLDGERMALTGDGSLQRREVITSDQVQELAAFLVTAEQLRAIANANEVRVRVSGSRRNIDKTFDAENRERFRAFVEQHVAQD